MKRRRAEIIRPLHRRAITAMAFAVALAFVTRARAQVDTLNQSFTGTTAPGWVFGGSGFTPELTAAQGIDPTGSGWLRLTSPSTNESTYAYDSTSFASANATITAQFNLAVYDGTGADGITFFLADASVPFAAGAYGGSLGYAQKTLAGGGGADIDGMAGGYLGIGVDEFGNYSNPTEGRIGGTGFVANAVAVRGPGSGLTGYNYLGGTSSLSTPLSYPGQTTRPTGSQAETIQMVLTSTNQLTVSVEFGSSGVFSTIFTADLSGYTRPNDLIMGFTGSTGANTDIHEIQDVELSSVSANLWTSNGGDTKWNTANNWEGNPAEVPSVGSDVLLNNAYVSTAQTVDLGTNNEIIRSLQIDAPFTYTVQNGTLEFNNEGVVGTSGIVVTQTNGHAVQTINANLLADNAIVIENNTYSALNLGGNLATGGNAVNFNGSGTVTDTGIVSGTGMIYQSGTGTTTLSGANTYSGGTTITAGTLVANSSTALGATAGGVILSGGTLASTNSSTVANPITLEGNAALSGITSSGAFTQSGGSYTLNLANSTLSNTVAISNTTTAQTLTTEVDSGTSTISGVISNGGGSTGGSLSKTGAGTLALNAVNTYTGATIVSGGTLSVGTNNAINSASNLTLTNSTLELNGNSDKVGNLTFTNGTIDFGSGSPTNAFVFANATGTGVLTIDDWTSGHTSLAATNSAVATSVLNDVYFSGIGSGAIEAGSLTTVGSEGSAYLITPNNVFLTWNGGAGTGNPGWNKTANWVSGAPSATAGSTQKIDFAGTVSLAPTMDQSYSANAIKFSSGAGAFVITQNSKVLTLDGNVPSIIDDATNAQTISGGSITAGVTGTPVNTVVDVVSGGKLTISSAITGQGSLTKVDSGTLALSGNNVGYISPITVQGGILSVSGSNNVLGTSSTTIDSGASLQVTDGRTLTNAITVGGTGASVGALDGNAGSGNTATLSGAIALTGATTIESDSGTFVLSGGLTGSGDNLSFTGAGATTVSSIIGTGAGTVTLNGTGTTTLSGANTYTGLTTVNSGTLDLNGTSPTVNGGLTLNGGTVVDGASSQLATGSALAVNAGTYNLNNFSENVATLNGNPGGTLGLGTGTLEVSGTGSMSYGGAITGTGTLDKENTGKLVLSGASTGFTGNVTLNDGVIDATSTNATGTAAVAVASSGNFEVQGGITLGSAFNLSTNGASTGNGALENITGNNTVTGAVTVSANSTIQSDAGTLTLSGPVGIGANTLTVTGNSNTTLSGAVTGTGTLAMTGVGTLDLTAASTGLTGNIAVSSGILNASATNATGTAAVAVSGTGAFQVQGSSTLGSAFALSTTTSPAIESISGTNVISGAVTATANSRIQTDAGSLTFSNTFGIGSTTLNVGGSGNTTLSGAITGTSAITKDGTGTLILGGSNTAFTGTETVSAGTLQANSTGAFNSSNAVTVASGATLNLNNNSQSIGTLNDAGTLTMGTGSLTLSSGTSAISGAVTGSGTLTVNGTGAVVDLSGTNSGFTGPVAVTSGILNAGASAAAGTGAVTVSGSSTFQVQGGSTLANNFTTSTTGLSGNGAIENVSGNNTLSGTITGTGATRIQSDSGTLTASNTIGMGTHNLDVGGTGDTTLNGAVTGSGGLTKDGTGTLVLGAANSNLTGTISINAGTVQENVANAFKTTSVISVATGAILNLNSNSQTLNSITDSGTIAFGSGSANLTLATGATTLTGLTGTGTLTIDTGATVTLSASIVDSGLNIVLAGGTLKLAGTEDTFGSLNVTGNSTLDFANPSVSTITVSGVSVTAGKTLSVTNWANMVDYFYSTSSPGAQGTAPIDQIAFTGYSGSLTHWNTYTDGPGAQHEITPVPEPATYGAIFVGISLGALMIARRRRTGL